MRIRLGQGLVVFGVFVETGGRNRMKVKTGIGLTDGLGNRALVDSGMSTPACGKYSIREDVTTHAA